MLSDPEASVSYRKCLRSALVDSRGEESALMKELSSNSDSEHLVSLCTESAELVRAKFERFSDGSDSGKEPKLLAADVVLDGRGTMLSKCDVSRRLPRKSPCSL